MKACVPEFSVVKDNIAAPNKCMGLKMDFQAKCYKHELALWATINEVLK